MESIGQRLRRIREASGLGSKRLSEVCGLSTSHVRMIEAGDVASPDLRTLERIAAKAGVPASWLAFGAGEYPGDDAVKASVDESHAEFLVARGSGAAADDPTDERGAA